MSPRTVCLLDGAVTRVCRDIAPPVNVDEVAFAWRRVELTEHLGAIRKHEPHQGHHPKTFAFAGMPAHTRTASTSAAGTPDATAGAIASVTSLK